MIINPTRSQRKIALVVAICMWIIITILLHSGITVTPFAGHLEYSMLGAVGTVMLGLLLVRLLIRGVDEIFH